MHTLMRPLTGFCFAVSFSFLILLGGSAVAIQNGQDGLPGNPGDPGTTGTAGASAADQTLFRFGGGIPYFYRGFGWNGGDGGGGGNGVDGPDAGTSADGGAGGNGGDGGNVYTRWRAAIQPYHQAIQDYAIEVLVESKAGRGGDGGVGGTGEQGGLDGVGGNGGRGGDGWAVAEGGYYVSGNAWGGQGGNATGTGARAGDGGYGGGITRLFHTDKWNGTIGTSNPPQAFLTLYGGNGGEGFLGADGGNGAAVWFGNEYSHITGQATRDWGAFLTAVGGTGGNSQSGIAGTGGSIYADLGYSLNPAMLQNPGPYGSSYNFQLFGGNGGSGTAVGSQTVNGGNGGDIVLRNSPFVAEARYIRVDARSGNGGNALGHINYFGTAGRGGDISSNTLWIAGGMHQIEYALTGGRGGQADGAARGGNGGSIYMVNPVASTSPSFTGNVQIVASGGNGGDNPSSNNNATGGDGGNVNISMLDAFVDMRDSLISVRAFGGWSGNGGFPGGIERGGNAYVKIQQNFLDRGIVEASAYGGRTDQHFNGSSTAIAEVGAYGNSLNKETRAIANAQPLPYSTQIPFPLAAFGGNSYALASATRTSGLGEMLATANAEGGFGTNTSGWSYANATAINTTTAPASGNNPIGKRARAVADSRARADRNPSTANIADSFATAISSSSATAVSTARSEGQFNYGWARAAIRSPVGNAFATATGVTTAWAHTSNVQANIETSGAAGNIAANLHASAFTSFRQTFLAGTSGQEAYTHVLVNPGKSAVDSFVASSSLMDSVFEYGDRDYVGNVVAIGTAGGGYSGIDQLTGTVNVNGRVALFFDLIDNVQNTDNLFLGIFNSRSSGLGFDTMRFAVDYNGQFMLEEEFDNLLSAQSFFDDNLFALESFSVPSSLDRAIVMTWELSISRPFDSFGFDFVIGNGVVPMQAMRFSSVPEAGTGWAVLLLVGMVARNRNRGKLEAGV